MLNLFFTHVGKPQKDFFLVARPLRGGREVRAWLLRKKIFCWSFTRKCYKKYRTISAFICPFSFSQRGLVLLRRMNKKDNKGLREICVFIYLWILDVRIPQHVAVIAEVRSVHPVNFRSWDITQMDVSTFKVCRSGLEISRIRFCSNKIHHSYRVVIVWRQIQTD